MPPAAPAPARALRTVAVVLFYGYVLTLLAAGAWGLFGARVDFPVLMGQKLGQLHGGGIDVLSQYRFLRGIELGLAAFALRFRHEIFTERTLNELFLFAMGCGILGRVLGVAIDGVPSELMLSFLGYEAVAIVLIVVVTRPARSRQPGEAAGRRR